MLQYVICIENQEYVQEPLNYEEKLRIEKISGIHSLFYSWKKNMHLWVICLIPLYISLTLEIFFLLTILLNP